MGARRRRTRKKISCSHDLFYHVILLVCRRLVKLGKNRGQRFLRVHIITFVDPPSQPRSFLLELVSFLLFLPPNRLIVLVLFQQRQLQSRLPPLRRPRFSAPSRAQVKSNHTSSAFVAAVSRPELKGFFVSFFLLLLFSLYIHTGFRIDIHSHGDLSGVIVQVQCRP